MVRRLLPLIGLVLMSARVEAQDRPRPRGSWTSDAQVIYSLAGDLGGTRGGIIGRLVSEFWP
jgi:hypothetical protein